FEALSYVWGDSLRQREIICGDSEVDIGINLHEALEGLRLPDQERVVWADALCINQADIKERTHQVQQIGEVYSTAQRVLIWLGKETDANRGAFKMIRAICAEYPNQMARWVDEARELGYLSNLLRHSWFRRIWVTQELASARSAVVMCGKSELSWNVFKGVVDFLWPIIPHQYAKETYELGPPP
ncbi:HET-domain-containing protein, partial [Lophium mytilinum]